MSNLAKHIIGTIALVVACCITIPSLVKAIGLMVKHIYMYWWFLGGGLLYIVLCFLILKKNLSFLQTLSHESLHMVACLLMFRKVESLKATASDGGELYHYGNQNMFISLAPYTLPFFTIIFLLIQTIIPYRFSWFGIVVGFSFFFYLHSFISQAKPYQTDLQAHGLICSYLYIFSMASFNIAICLLAVDMKFFNAISWYFSDVWNSISGFVACTA